MTGNVLKPQGPKGPRALKFYQSVNQVFLVCILLAVLISSLESPKKPHGRKDISVHERKNLLEKIWLFKNMTYPVEVIRQTKPKKKTKPSQSQNLTILQPRQIQIQKRYKEGKKRKKYSKIGGIRPRCPSWAKEPEAW